MKKVSLYLLAGYLFFGFVVVPYIAKSQIVDNVSNNINGTLTLQSVSFNPLVCELSLSGISIVGENKEELINLKSLTLNVEVYSLLLGTIHISDFVIEKPQINAVLDENKVINFSKLARESNKRDEKEEDSKGTLPHIVIDNISLIEGTLNYKDFSKKSVYEVEVQKIGFQLQNIDTKNISSRSGEMTFYSKLEEGGFIDIKSEILSLEPLSVSGSLNFESGKLYTQWRYVKDSLNIELADGQLSLNGGYQVDLGDLNATKISDLNLEIKDLRLKPKEQHQDILNLDYFAIKNVNLKPLMQDVKVEQVKLDSLKIQVKRDQNKVIDWIDHIKMNNDKKVLEESQEGKPQKQETKSWSIVIDDVNLENIGLDFHDEALTPNAVTSLNEFNLYAKNIDSNPNTWLNYNFSGKVNNKGIVSSKGKLRHTPLSQKGDIELRKITLEEINPYLQEHLYAYIDDGEINLKASTTYNKSKTTPDLNLQGSFWIDDFFINSSHDKLPLLSFNKFDIQKFTLELFPNRLYVDTIDLNSFYVNARIDDKKTMNFAKLVKKPQIDEVKTQKTKEKTTKTEAFPMKIAKINIHDGSAIFEDISLPIKFKTNIHTINGVIYDISPGEDAHTTVDISGEVDKYGSTQLSGTFNAFDPMSYTDLGFNFKNINLSAMSGYSSTFAGYKIDDGKLFLDLNYDIKDSQLLGENSVVIKKIELGDELVVEGGSSLPLGLAIALLEDSEGVIDIDMPVGGDIDNPDFKYGALVVKTLANLIVKAVASPFKFLGASLGIDGEDLEFIEFEAAKSVLQPSQKEKLDTIVKFMEKRPKIMLGVGASYDELRDKKALQRAKLLELVAKESGAKNEREKINALTVSLLEDIYEEIKDDDFLDQLEEELDKKYDGDEFDKIYFESLVDACTNIQVVTQKELESLALERRANVLHYLSELKKVDISRFQAIKLNKSTKANAEYVATHLELIVK